MWRAPAFLALSAIIAFSQPVDSKPTFEVASVKPSGPNSIRGSDGGPGSPDPERYIFGKVHLSELIYLAYDLHAKGQISGPGWMEDDNFIYDLAVKMPKATTKAEFRMMLQSLLAERFNLVAHNQPKEFPVYDLVVAKNGPKFKESGSSPEDNRHLDGFPDLPPGRPGMTSTFNNDMIVHLRARQQTIARVAALLSASEDRQVMDETGLAGQYDFLLTYALRVPRRPGEEVNAPFLREAVEEQLGLKLVDGKRVFDVIVVDHAEKTPTEN